MEIFRKYSPLQDMDNVLNAVNPLSGRTTLYAGEEVSRVQQIYPDTVASSLQQTFTTIQVLHIDSSSKTQEAFLIASEYYVHLWSGVQHLYTAMEVSRSFYNLHEYIYCEHQIHTRSIMEVL